MLQFPPWPRPRPAARGPKASSLPQKIPFVVPWVNLRCRVYQLNRNQRAQSLLNLREVLTTRRCARLPSRLPDESERKLNVTVVVDRFCDRAKLWRVEGAVGNLELRRVHDVEQLRPEL